MSFIYLASPFTAIGPDKDAIEAYRTYQAALATATLHAHGYHVYSPIVHGVGYQNYLLDRDRSSHDFWMEHCLNMLAAASGLFVLRVNGTAQSKGVAMEIARAQQVLCNFQIKIFDLHFTKSLSSQISLTAIHSASNFLQQLTLNVPYIQWPDFKSAFDAGLTPAEIV